MPSKSGLLNRHDEIPKINLHESIESWSFVGVLEDLRTMVSMKRNISSSSDWAVRVDTLSCAIVFWVLLSIWGFGMRLETVLAKGRFTTDLAWI